MNPERKNSKAILDSYVAAKEINLAAGCTDSRHFDPVWLYERVLAMPEPPDQKEKRCSARAMIKAGHALLVHARPDLAGEVFEIAYVLLFDTKSGMLCSKAMAGIVMSWEQMGKPKAGAAFVERALRHVEQLLGEKTKQRRQTQLTKAMERAKRVKLPRTIKAPTGDYMPRSRKTRAHTSTLLKKGV